MRVLYIPGLGEGFVLTAQKAYIRLLNLFRNQNNKIIIFQSNWDSSELFTEKLSRLKEFYKSGGSPEVIAAPSAGAALAVSLYARNKSSVRHVHIICGKIKGSEKIGQKYQRRAPALLGAVKASEKHLRSIASGVIISYVPDNTYDGVIETEDMYSKGMEKVQLPDYGHGHAIAYWLMRFLPRL